MKFKKGYQTLNYLKCQKEINVVTKCEKRESKIHIQYRNSAISEIRGWEKMV